DRGSGGRRQPERPRPGHLAGSPGCRSPRRDRRERDARGAPFHRLTPGCRTGRDRRRSSSEGGRPTAELAQPLVAAPERVAHKLRRDVGLVGLVFASFGSIIGAGWLFGALYASSLAGPAAIVAWVIGRAAMVVLALSHAELGGTYPVAGGNARFPHYAFGNLVGFTSGWVAFLGAVTVAPIMVQATLLYASNWAPSLTTVSSGRPVLTAQGYVVAALLMLL